MSNENTIQIVNKKRFVGLESGRVQLVFIAIFSILYLIRDLGDVVFPDILFSGLCAVFFVISNTEASLGIYIFTTVLTVPHNEIALFYLLGLVFHVILKKGFKFNGTLVCVTACCFLLQIIDMMLFSSLEIVSFVYKYVVIMLPIVFPMVWFGSDFSSTAFKNALRCYVLGVMLGGTITLILTGNDVGWDVLLQGADSIRLGITNEELGAGMQTTYNSNQLSTMFSICAAILLLFTDKKWLPKSLGVIFVAYSFFIILLTRSRTGILMFLFAVLIYYFTLIFRRKKFSQGIAGIIVLIVAVLLVINVVPGVFDGVMNRFKDQDDLSNGRIDLFGLYFDAWDENVWSLLFGYGIGSYFEMVDIGISPHNSIIDVLICWGFLGLFLIMITLFVITGNTIKYLKKEWLMLAFLPASISFISSLAGQYLTSGSVHTTLCFLILSANAFAQDPRLVSQLSEGNIDAAQ